MIPVSTLYGEYIDRPKLTEKKHPFEYIVPPPSRGWEQKARMVLFVAQNVQTFPFGRLQCIIYLKRKYKIVCRAILARFVEIFCGNCNCFKSQVLKKTGKIWVPKRSKKSGVIFSLTM